MCVCCYHHQDPESPYFYKETHDVKYTSGHKSGHKHETHYDQDEEDSGYDGTARIICFPTPQKSISDLDSDEWGDREEFKKKKK